MLPESKELNLELVEEVEDDIFNEYLNQSNDDNKETSSDSGLADDQPKNQEFLDSGDYFIFGKNKI